MRIEKIVEVAIDIQNTIDIYSNEQNLKHILVNRFEKRCFRGCYIHSVDEVMRTGECVINQDGRPTYGTIPICFRVTAEEYVEGEILHGCSVTKITGNGIIVCETGIASIMLKSHELLDGIRQGQIISVRVGAAKYIVGAEKINVNAIPFLPSKNPTFYLALNDTVYNKNIFDNTLARIEFEEGELKKLSSSNSTAVSAFNTILQVSKDDFVLPDEAKKANIIELVRARMEGPAIFNQLLDSIAGKNRTTVYFTRGLIRDLTQPTLIVVYAPDNRVPTWIEGSKIIANASIENVMLVLLEDYCSYLRSIREMIHIYSTPELLADHKNLWLLYKKSKI